MADGIRRLTFTTTELFKNFPQNFGSKSKSEQPYPEINERKFSDPSADRVIPEYSPNQSIQNDLDSLVTENENNSNLTITSIFGGTQQQYQDNESSSSFLRLNRAHWKDTSKFNHCHRCAKPFGFAGRKFNCRRLDFFLINYCLVWLFHGIIFILFFLKLFNQ